MFGRDLFILDSSIVWSQRSGLDAHHEPYAKLGSGTYEAPAYARVSISTFEEPFRYRIVLKQRLKRAPGRPIGNLLVSNSRYVQVHIYIETLYLVSHVPARYLKKGA